MNILNCGSSGLFFYRFVPEFGVDFPDLGVFTDGGDGMALGEIGAEAQAEREARARKEEKRLLKIFRKIDEDRKKTVLGLIQRAAFMRVMLEDLEEDINIFGVTERFQQGEQEPYDRERPSSKVYNQMNGSYQKLIKQLTDLLPKGDGYKKDGDPFEQF